MKYLQNKIYKIEQPYIYIEEPLHTFIIQIYIRVENINDFIYEVEWTKIYREYALYL